MCGGFLPQGDSVFLSFGVMPFLGNFSKEHPRGHKWSSIRTSTVRRPIEPQSIAADSLCIPIGMPHGPTSQIRLEQCPSVLAQRFADFEHRPELLAN